MSKSYDEINYFLRVKKQIERKIVIEALQRLDHLIDIGSYHYVGMGSIYFVDFILFHKYLKIDKLTSIDRNKDDEARFKFNKPFGFINFHVYDINYYVQNLLNWEEKLFLWLDYDDEIDKDKLEVFEYIGAKAKPNDLLLITVGAQTQSDPKSFRAIYGDILPPMYKLKEIKEKFPETLNKILSTVLKKGLNAQTRDIIFQPIFNYVYRNGKKMYTYGGIFAESKNISKVNENLQSLQFISLDNKIINLNCPIVTPKEKMLLDSAILKDGELLDSLAEMTGIGREKLSQYKEKLSRYKVFYKHYPQFFESIY